MEKFFSISLQKFLCVCVREGEEGEREGRGVYIHTYTCFLKVHFICLISVYRVLVLLLSPSVPPTPFFFLLPVLGQIKTEALCT